jgi:hypothetical protein
LSIGVTIIIAIILLFVTSSGCTEDKPEVKIIHPDKEINWQESIGGTAKNIPNNYQLWVLVYSDEKKEYYPINKTEPKYDDWRTPAIIGSKDDSGKEFDIIAVLADKKAQDRFNDSLKENKDGNYSHGIYSIPDGAKEYDRITVTRKSDSLFGFK